MLQALFYLTLITSITLVVRTISTAQFRSLTPDAVRPNPPMPNPTATPSEATLLILGSYNSIRTGLGIKEASDLVRRDLSSEPISKLNQLPSSHALIAPLLLSSASESKRIREPSLLRIRKRSSVFVESSQTISKLTKSSATLHFVRELSEDSVDIPLLPFDQQGNQKGVPLRDILSSYERAYRSEKVAEGVARKKRPARKKKTGGMKLAVLGSVPEKGKVSRAGRGKAGRND